MTILRILLAVVLLANVNAMIWAQTPEVPHKMQFAGMTLTIRDDARREIQKDVDALTQSPRHFNIKAERAKTYFPIIERIFDEERVPIDFKYLVLQESSLIADAVSPSNAVGFWQFKDYTAVEMGMRVDRQIDERMNIVSATRGAARYIKKNNFYFNNWVYALQSYQMGAGGVMQSVSNSESGAQHMEITSNTYWYVKKFLAHKVAFEAVSGPGQLQVITLENKAKKSITELAKEISVDEMALRDYNKWLKSDIIPEDKMYVVLVPVTGNIGETKPKIDTPAGNNEIIKSTDAGIAMATLPAVKAGKINGLPTIIALPGEDAGKLATRAGVDLNDFLRWNDIALIDPIRPGQLYFLTRKRTRGSENFHKVLPGEDLWIISQNYGVQMKKLKKYNRLDERGLIEPGVTLWLSSKRPKETNHSIPESTDVAQIDNKESFNWTANPSMQGTTNGSKIETAIIHAPEIKKDPILKVTDSTKTIPTVPNVPSVESLVKDSIFSITVKKTEHIVVAGETLYSIANQNGVGVMDLVNWNNLNLQAGIRPGQVLKLTESQSVNPSTDLALSQTEIIHVVKASDTLYSVARKYGVTIKELMEWNEKKDFNLNAGEKLKIIRK